MPAVVDYLRRSISRYFNKAVGSTKASDVQPVVVMLPSPIGQIRALQYSNTALAAGTNQVTLFTVPDGYCAIIDTAVWRYTGTVTSVRVNLNLIRKEDGLNYRPWIIGGKTNPTSATWYQMSQSVVGGDPFTFGAMYAAPGDKIELEITNATLNDDIDYYMFYRLIPYPYDPTEY